MIVNKTFRLKISLNRMTLVRKNPVSQQLAKPSCCMELGEVLGFNMY